MPSVKSFKKINDTTFKIPIGNEEVEIGDKDSDSFKPHAKLKRWGEECWIKLELPIAKNIQPIEEKGKLEWVDSDKEVHFYPLEPRVVTEGKSKFEQLKEGGFEFELILKEKPTTNKISLLFESQGLEFWYQPALTQEEKDRGARRPENVVGSYAVYHKEQKKFIKSQAEGEKYKIGKAFHIYRPKIIDSDGWEVWGELNIDAKKGELTVTIPQDFIDNAVYPIRHAAGLDFGFTGDGASDFAFFDSLVFTATYLDRLGTKHTTTTEAGIITSMKGRVKTTDTIDLMLATYNFNGGGAGTHTKVESGLTSISNSAYDWIEIDFSGDNSISTSSSYVLAVTGGDSTLTWMDEPVSIIAYDSVGGIYDVQSFDYAQDADPTMPDNWSGASEDVTDRKFSIYVVYSAGGVDITVEPSAETLTLTLQTPTVDSSTTFEPSVLALTLTQQTPTIDLISNNTIEPNTQTLTLVLQSPTVVIPITIEPSATTLTLSQQTPDVNFDYDLDVAAQALSLTLQTPTIDASASFEPESLDLTLTLPVPTTTISSSVSPDALALTLALQTPTIVSGTIITPSALNLTTSLKDPTLNYDFLKTVAAQTLTLALQTPTVYASAISEPSAQDLTLTLQAPTIISSTIVEPSVLSLSASLKDPTVNYDFTKTVSALNLTLTQQTPDINLSTVQEVSALNLALTLQTPTLIDSEVITPSALSLALTLQTPTAVWSSKVTPDTLALTLAIQTPDIDTSTIFEPNALALATTLNTPIVSGTALVEPSTLELTSSLETPTITFSSAVSPSALALVLSLKTPTFPISSIITPSVQALSLSVLTPLLTLSDSYSDMIGVTKGTTSTGITKKTSISSALKQTSAIAHTKGITMTAITKNTDFSARTK